MESDEKDEGKMESDGMKEKKIYKCQNVMFKKDTKSGK